MTIIQAIILGIVQGLTELLPISSSAHLNIIPWLFNWSIPESFDVALHLGTLLAITIFFFKDWLSLIKGGYDQVIKKKKSTQGKLFWFIVAVTIPTGILSLVLDKVSDMICEKFGIEMILIGVALIVLGIVLYVVDKKSKSEVSLENMTFKQSFFIGLSQAIAAAFPGTSRSGITMTVARALKLDRESAAKYSFLLSTPIILAAVLVSIKDFEFTLAFFMGVLASFLTGILVIKFLMDYLKKGSFKGFAIYRVIIGIAIIVLTFVI
ncbi:MAG: undecaprenyl-diphosphate phosphatase [Clostridia bacterium]|nr:undecaprenyl-diphosphate phosphatase [Clostridia bacterium]